MNGLVVSLAWCWAQSFVVAALAIGLSRLAMRKSPAAGAAIAWAGVLATLGLTLLAPAPLPRWRLQFESMWAEPISQHFQQNPPHWAPTVDTTSDSQSAAMFNLELLRGILASVERSQAIVADHRTASRIVLGVVAAGICYSLSRTLIGWWAIARLHRTSRIITDDRLIAVVEELADRLRLRARPQLRESDSLVSAAVIGEWRPTVVLPAAWREWTSIELRAVIAHELAHVGRRDFALRLVASLAVALQFTQPIVYWLRRQLLLAQELAADDLAASAVGGRAEYLQALSKLALRQDARPIDGSMGLLLPVFSGFLLRRIDMLRAKDGSPRRGSRLLQWSAIAVLAAVAASTAALRVLAQPPDAPADGSVRVARSTNSKPVPAVAAADAHASQSTLFQRPRFDLSAIPLNKQGGFLVRLGEILRRAEFAEPARALDESFQAGWKDLFPEAPRPDFALADIEYIAGDFRLTFKRSNQPKDVENPNQMMFGATGVVVRWQKPLNGQYEWMLRTPGAVEKSHGDTSYVELPIVAPIGPTKPCVCRLDERTLLLVQHEQALRTWLDKLAAPADPPTWHKAWESVEGGLITVVASPNIVHPLADPGDPEWRHRTHELISRVGLYAVGADWQEASDGVRTLKCKFDCENAEAALTVRDAIRYHVDQWLIKTRELAGGTDEKAMLARSHLNLLEQVTVESREIERGWQIELQFTGPLDIQSIWKQ